MSEEEHGSSNFDCIKYEICGHDGVCLRHAPSLCNLHNSFVDLISVFGGQIMELLNYEKVSTGLSLFLQEQDKVFCFFSNTSGIGKTHVLRKYCLEHKSAFYIHLPQSIAKSPRMILLGILHSLEVPFIKRASSEAYLDILRLELTKRQLSVLVIDEMQKIDFETFELFIWLSDELDVKFIFAGTEIPDLAEHVAKHSEIVSAV